MRIVGSKAEIKQPMAKLLANYPESGNAAFVKGFCVKFLKTRIRFRLLEFLGAEIFKNIPIDQQLTVADQIVDLKEIGGNPVAGMILQLRLEKHFKQSIEKAIEYIVKGNEWYVCDIIGERVMGHALLKQPKKTLAILKSFAKHENKWIVRSVGVATHYAVKKGLSKTESERAFLILLSCASEKEFHTKKGIGWAAKTIAKFHPDIIKKYERNIADDERIKRWFKTKIKIGLSRSYKYASRYSG